MQALLQVSCKWPSNINEKSNTFTNYINHIFMSASSHGAGVPRIHSLVSRSNSYQASDKTRRFLYRVLNFL